MTDTHVPREIHLVSENEELSERNGSAVLRVARSLAKEARDKGIESVIGGSELRHGDLEHSVAAYASRQLHVPSMLQKALRLVAPGALLTAPSTLDLSSYTHFIVHNQPWLAARLRKLYSNAHITLYVHNQIMQRVPTARMRRVLGAVDCVAGVSSFVLTDLASRAAVPIEDPRLTVIHNGVDSSRFKEAGLPTYDVGFVGRLVPEKGLHVLIDALVELKRRGFDVTATIAGGAGFIPGEIPNPYAQQLQAHLRAENLAVNWNGVLPPAHIPRLMNDCRIIVVPSVWDDPCPLVVFEALASSAAVIATRTGGITELTNAGLVLIDASDPWQLAGEIARLLENPATRATQSADGTSWARTRTWQAAYEKLLACRA